MEKIIDEEFDELVSRLESRKKITSRVVRAYCELWSLDRALAEKKKRLSSLIKEVMDENKQTEAKFPECPFMLTISQVTYTPVTTVDWEGIAGRLAVRLFGKKGKKDKRFRELEEAFTSTEQKDPTKRLNEPQPNPDYQS